MRIDNHLHWTSDVALIYQDGQLLNSRLLDYRIPTMADLPAALRSILVESADGPGSHGSKSIGESGLTPTAPTIAPAIDVRLTALQLTPRTRLAGAVRRIGTSDGLKTGVAKILGILMWMIRHTTIAATGSKGRGISVQCTSASTMGTVSAIMDRVIGEKEGKGEHQNTRHRLVSWEGKARLRVAVQACPYAPKVSRLVVAYQAVKHDRAQEVNYVP